MEKKQIKKYLNKMDAEIMDWFYEMVELHFDTVMVLDSTHLRNILEENLEEIAELQKKNNLTN